MKFSERIQKVQPSMTLAITAKANVYFEGKVVSHSLTTEEGESKSIGLIFPGSYHFGTGAPERMDIISGSCKVVVDGTSETLEVDAGSAFEVAGNSGFTITVEDCICEYICSYLPA